LYLPHGKPNQQDYNQADGFINQASKLWDELGLSHMPKWHSLLNHALKQMHYCDGFGDMLEDVIKFSHQIGDKDEQRLSCLKNFEKKSMAQA